MVAFWRMILAVGFVVAGLLSGAPARAVLPGLPPEAMCGSEAARFERVYALPPQLLDAISIVETGRWNPAKKATFAWPWTVTANGDGKFFPTKAEAIAEVKRLRAAGTKSIDVGCMQVNLMWHAEAFANLDEAFDPSANVDYAARFVKELYAATKHWPTAASYYHSQTPDLAAEYRRKLMKIWGAPVTAPAAAVASAAPSTQAAPAKPPARLTASRVMTADTDAGEFKQIADAYRQARMAEYKIRRAHRTGARRTT